MSNSHQQYVFGLRWETRCVVAFIIVTFVGIVTMIYADALASSLILGSLIIVGSALALSLRQLLRDDYLHTTSATTIVAMVPPISLATVYVGMLSSWMQRMGFGMFMRIGVTSLIVWSVVAGSMSLSATESTLVLVTSVSTSVIRQAAVRSWYLVPWTTGAICLMLLRVLLS